MRKPHLALVETPPASPEAVARMIEAARDGGRALALQLADDLEIIAKRAETLAGCVAVSDGARDVFRVLALQTPGAVANVRDLA